MEITSKGPKNLQIGSPFNPHFTQKYFFSIEKVWNSNPENKILFKEALAVIGNYLQNYWYL